MSKPDDNFLTGEVSVDSNTENERNSFFLLSDSTHAFTIKVSDCLECLKFAEEKGQIPELPTEWWNRIGSLFPQLEDLVDPDKEKNDSF